MQHAWSGYRACAFGKDEVAPATCQGKDIDNYGVSTTLVDSLDTLWLMGMKEEFEEAREWIGENLEHDADKLVSTFENTIRSLGGLLSAYDWSGDAVFLEKAVDLGDRLIKAFDSPSGIPYSHVNLKTGVGKNSNWNSRGTSIAEAGTLQIEFRFLAKVTGNVTYADKAEHVFDLLGMLKTEDGLYFNHVMNMNNVSSTSAGSKLTFGGEADSFYEYMLKLWLQGGKTEDKYRDMYDEAIEGMHNVLLQYSNSPAKLAYIAKKMSGKNGKLVHEFEHLECFMGGLLALGAHTDPLGIHSERSMRDMKTAKALTYTCYQMYATNPTGLGLENAAQFNIPHHGNSKVGVTNKHVIKQHKNNHNPFENRREQVAEKLSEVAKWGQDYETHKALRDNKKRNKPSTADTGTGTSGEEAEQEDDTYDFVKGSGVYYMLRPEVVESFYILNKITGDPIYREWGWEIFQSIEKFCKHPFGYGHFPDVTNAKRTAENNMESFFLGETLKYLYLLMDPDSEVDLLETHVFNTEAHPLRMFDVLERSEKE